MGFSKESIFYSKFKVMILTDLHIIHERVSVNPGVLAQTVQVGLIDVLDSAQLVQSHGEGVDGVVDEGRGGVEVAGRDGHVGHVLQC